MTDLHYCADRIKFHHEKAVEGWQTTLEHAWRCGKYLGKAKKLLGHGRFLKWVCQKQNFPGSERTARYYMRLAKMYKEPPIDTGATTIADALNGVVAMGKKGSTTKRLKPKDTVPGQMLSQLLRYAWRNWTQDQIHELKTQLQWSEWDELSDRDPTCEYERLFSKAMRRLQKAVRARLQQHALEVRKRKRAPLDEARRLRFAPLLNLPAERFMRSPDNSEADATPF